MAPQGAFTRIITVPKIQLVPRAEYHIICKSLNMRVFFTSNREFVISTRRDPAHPVSVRPC